jgi:hypothetical protein
LSSPLPPTNEILKIAPSSAFNLYFARFLAPPKCPFAIEISLHHSSSSVLLRFPLPSKIPSIKIPSSTQASLCYQDFPPLAKLPRAIKLTSMKHKTMSNAVSMVAPRLVEYGLTSWCDNEVELSPLDDLWVPQESNHRKHYKSVVTKYIAFHLKSSNT